MCIQTVPLYSIAKQTSIINSQLIQPFLCGKNVRLNFIDFTYIPFDLILVIFLFVWENEKGSNIIFRFIFQKMRFFFKTKYDAKFEENVIWSKNNKFHFSSVLEIGYLKVGKGAPPHDSEHNQYANVMIMTRKRLNLAPLPTTYPWNSLPNFSKKFLFRKIWIQFAPNF